MQRSNRRVLLPGLLGAAALLVAASPASAQFEPMFHEYTIEEVNELPSEFFNEGETGMGTAVIDTATPDQDPGNPGLGLYDGVLVDLFGLVGQIGYEYSLDPAGSSSVVVVDATQAQQLDVIFFSGDVTGLELAPGIAPENFEFSISAPYDTLDTDELSPAMFAAAFDNAVESTFTLGFNLDFLGPEPVTAAISGRLTSLQVVPVPGGLWLLGGGLMALPGIPRRASLAVCSAFRSLRGCGPGPRRRWRGPGKHL